jgi:hypothetical protein
MNHPYALGLTIGQKLKSLMKTTENKEEYHRLLAVL